MLIDVAAVAIKPIEGVRGAAIPPPATASSKLVTTGRPMTPPLPVAVLSPPPPPPREPLPATTPLSPPGQAQLQPQQLKPRRENQVRPYYSTPKAPDYLSTTFVPCVLSIHPCHISCHQHHMRNFPHHETFRPSDRPQVAPVQRLGRRDVRLGVHRPVDGDRPGGVTPGSVPPVHRPARRRRQQGGGSRDADGLPSGVARGYDKRS